jgi:hypothetical protein
MNLSTIEQGEELLKRATPGTWYARYAYKKEEALRQMNLIGATAAGHAIVTDHEGGTHPSQNLELLVWMRNHASELLQMAREVEELKKKVENLQWHYNDMQSRNPDA